MRRVSPSLLRFLLNIYGPYLGAGVRVHRIRDDWREMQVSMKLRWYNRNAVGTHFGGSLYSMIDPHLMLMLMQILGPEYHVWDKAAEIEFISPGRGEVFSTISISESDLEQIRKHTSLGEKYFPQFAIEIHDSVQTLIARATKTLYVRKKR